MFSICATKKLADHLGIKLEPAPGNAITQLGCWYANRLYVQGRQHVIFVSEATLLPVIVPAAPAKTIVPRFVHQLGMVLRELGVDEASIAIETASMNSATWAKTSNRSVLGSMNDFIKLLEHRSDAVTNWTLTELAVDIADTPCRAGTKDSIWPDDQTRQLFASDHSAESSGPTTGTVHELKITLRSVKPAVWRRIQVPSSIGLDELAGLLVAAMGWMGGHLHSYQVGDVHYQPEDPDGWFDSPMFNYKDEALVTLGEVLPTEKSKMRWDYDFGDGWEHNVIVERIAPADPQTTYPVCVDGGNSCPPEDCGGPWGYEEFLQAIADKAHPRHEELTEWSPLDFDAAHFDPTEATADMQSSRPLYGW